MWPCEVFVIDVISYMVSREQMMQVVVWGGILKVMSMAYGIASMNTMPII